MKHPRPLNSRDEALPRLTESAAPHQTRIFSETENGFVDLQRYTIKMASAGYLIRAHRRLGERGAEFGLTALEEIIDIGAGKSFVVCDLNRNWWEIACSAGDEK
jgi:hypothetical protein